MKTDKRLLAKGLMLATPVSLVGSCCAGDDAMLVAALLLALVETYGSRGLTCIRRRKAFGELAEECGGHFSRALPMQSQPLASLPFSNAVLNNKL